MTTVTTTDLFRSASLLARGARLERIDLQHRHRRRAMFVLSGPDVIQWEQAYISGCARIEPLKLNACLNQLRDRVLNHTIEE